MAGEDDEIVVTIEGETPDPDSGGAVVKVLDESKKAGAAADDDIVGSLKAQLAEKQTMLDSATQRASSAETVAGQATQRARQLEHEVTEARTQVAESTKSTIETGISAAKAESQAAQDALTVAFEAGDAKAVAQANRRIARAESELALLENAKVDVPAVEKRQPPAQAVDQIEAFISQHTPRTASWMREHRDFITDQKKNARMTAAHYEAVAEGFSADTDGYFDFVEKKLGLKKDAATQQQDTRKTTQESQRRPTAPTAPASASGGGMNGGVTEVRLSAAEARAATDGTLVHNTDDPTGKGRWKKGDVLGVQEVARRKSIMAKEGRYQNVSVDGT